MTTTQLLERADGRLAYTVSGSGPLVALSPGMGDLAGVYQDVVGPLVAAGFRVACTDLRGHGASTTTFASHGVSETASDLVALVEHLGGPAVVVGHSVSGTSATLAATRRPELVAGLVLVAPHLEPSPSTLAGRLQVQLLIRRPWGAAAWAWYYRSLHPGRKAAWFDAHVAQVHRSLREAGRFAAFRALALALLADGPAVPVQEVTAPTFVVLGDHDPEFRAPAESMRWLVEHLTGASRVESLLVPESGHYPHSQRADVVVPAVLAWLSRLPQADGAWGDPGTDTTDAIGATDGPDVANLPPVTGASA
ncbi:MAG TPA: alpha/beta hydrolase [Actinotalea sp.]